MTPNWDGPLTPVYVPGDLDGVASQVSQLSKRVARSYGGAEIPTLELLAADLAAGGHRLIGTDLLAAFPPEAVIPDADRGPGYGVRMLELARDVLVFVPVLVTWWQLRSALGAYDASVRAAAASHQVAPSFLLGWVRGFDGRTWSLTISALLVATVIAFIIVATLVAHIWQGMLYQRDSQDSERAWLASLLAQGNLLLAHVRRRESGTFTQADIQSLVDGFYQNSAHLAEELAKTRDQLTKALDVGPAAKLTKAIDDWRRAAVSLDILGKSLTVPSQILSRLQEIQRDFSQAGVHLSESIKQLVDQLSEQTLAAGQEAAAHAQLARDVSGATRQVGQAFDTFTIRLEQLGSLVSDLRDAIEQTRMTQRGDW